ncbi:MAG TPA: Gfo/Idh/MocA family oxidoreductase [Armatimonadetes bacterium]|nr:Gfo/Idh/MocA family oxidoreductase [Armatimonadota bacterium]
MAQQTINVGLVGYQFMGKAHSNAYRQVAAFFDDLELVPVMKAICGRTEEAVKAAAEKYGWEGYETSWEKLVEREDIGLIDVSTPNNMHAPVAIAAAKAGKHILCEKPLAMSVAEAKEMVQAVKEAGVVNMVCHNYRRAPAVMLAKQLIDQGELGEIYHFRGTYLQDWIVDPEFPLVWRLRKEVAGSGVHGDLNAHLIDLARFLVGEITEVVGLMETFIKERPLLEAVDERLGARAGEQRGEVTVDDAAAFLARFENGALGTFEATRFALGRKNYNRFEINGSKGSVVFNLERMNELELYLDSDPEYARGFRTIICNEAVHPYSGAYWPSGHIIGYEHTFINTVHDLLNGIAQGESPAPTFEDGLKNQAVLEAVERSVETGTWVCIGDLL